MPTIAWPNEAVPFKFLHDSYTETMGNNTYQFVPDQGPAISRRKASRRYDTLSGHLVLKLEQLNFFDWFYSERLADGAISFRAMHPRYRVESVFQFRNQESAPSWATYGTKYKLALTLQFRTLPTSSWILETGFWDDYGYWDDEEYWIDAP